MKALDNIILSTGTGVASPVKLVLLDVAALPALDNNLPALWSNLPSGSAVGVRSEDYLRDRHPLIIITLSNYIIITMNLAVVFPEV